MSSPEYKVLQEYYPKLEASISLHLQPITEGLAKPATGILSPEQRDEILRYQDSRDGAKKLLEIVTLGVQQAQDTFIFDTLLEVADVNGDLAMKNLVSNVQSYCREEYVGLFPESSNSPGDECDVFISYERDTNRFVDVLKERLESCGLKVFVDMQGTSSTGKWSKNVATALHSCKAFVALLTKDYVKSPYCRGELFQAVHLRKQLFPAIRESGWNLDPSGKSVQPNFHVFQYASVQDGGANYESQFRELIGNISEHCLPSDNKYLKIALETESPTQSVPDLTLNTMTVELESLTKPIEFGVYLNVPHSIMELIERNNHCDIEKQKIALFSYLASNSVPLHLSWAQIANALCNVDEDLALSIRKKYCSESEDFTENDFKQLSTDNLLELVDIVTQLDPNDIDHVLTLFNKESENWEDICTRLHVKGNVIEALKNSNKSQADCLKEALEDWLKLNYDHQTHGKPTWRMIAQSVVCVNKRLSLYIASLHTKPGVSVPVVAFTKAGTPKQKSISLSTEMESPTSEEGSTKISQNEAKLLSQILKKIDPSKLTECGIDAEMLATLASGTCVLTLKEMQDALYQISGVEKFAENLEEILKSRIKEEDMFKEAMADNLKLSVLYLKMIVLGPARVGKTTFLNRLLGMMKWDMDSDEKNQPTCSTGATDTNMVFIEQDPGSQSECVDVTTKKDYTSHTVGVSQTKWHRFKDNSKQEYATYINMIKNALDNRSTQVDPQPQDVKKHECEDKRTANSTQPLPTSNIPPQVNPNTESENKSSKKDPSLADVDELFQSFETLRQKAKTDPNIRLALQIIINTGDVGGQPAFLEMLPTLTIGPAMYMVLFKILQGLQDRYTVQFRSEGDDKDHDCEGYSYTSEDVIFTALSSIAFFGIPDEDLEKIVCSDGEKGQQSVVLLCGTHADEAENEKVEELDKQLQELLKESPFYEDDLVQYAESHEDEEKRRVLFKINNKSGGKEEVERYQKILKELIENKFRKFNIPASWFMLSMLLKSFASKKNRCTISIKECLYIGNRLGMSEEMVRFALKFLHKYIGIVMYFHDIRDEHLKEHVICSPQVVFKSISELIFKVYTPHNDIVQVGPGKYDRFKEIGQFCLEDINVEDKDDLLPVKSLVNLLVHLNIAAPISGDDLYFLPAVLETSPIDELLPSLVLTKPEATKSLLIQFKTGFLPLGVFCALIANLVATKNESFSLLQGKHECDGCQYFVKRNKVTFRAFGKCNVTLISRQKYIEIRVYHPPKPHNMDAKVTNGLAIDALGTDAIDGDSQSTDALATDARHLSNICPYVRKYVCEALDNVISTIKMKPSDVLTRGYCLGFRCDTHSASLGHETLALVKSDHYVPTSTEIPPKVTCQSCNNLDDLSKRMNDWFRHREYATLGKSVCLEIPKFITASSCSSDSSMQWKGPKAEFVTDKNTLKISSVTKDHFGYYTFEVKRGGKLMFRAHVELIEVPTTEVSEGKEIRLNEPAEGVSPPTYQWTRDGKDLEDDNDYSGSSTNCLVIKQPNVKLRGVYCCRVNNKEGEVTSDPTSLKIVDLKFSMDFDCEELVLWLEQNEVSGPTLQLIREQEIKGESFLALRTDKNELVKELDSLTIGAKITLIKLINEAQRGVSIDESNSRPQTPTSTECMDSENPPSTAHVTVENPPSTAHVTVENPPSTAHLIVSNTPPTAIVTVENSPSTAHVTVENLPPGPASDVYTEKDFENLSCDNVLELVNDTILDGDDLAAILDSLEKESANWQQICTKLHVSANAIQGLATSNKTNEVRLSDALTEWLKLNYNFQEHGKPTWRKVAESVVTVNTKLFLDIARQHLRKGVEVQ